jgi:hypothetical protein
MQWEGLLLNLHSMKTGEFFSPQYPEKFGLFTLPLKWNVISLLAHREMAVRLFKRASLYCISNPVIGGDSRGVFTNLMRTLTEQFK